MAKCVTTLDRLTFEALGQVDILSDFVLAGLLVFFPIAFPICVDKSTL